VSKHWRTTWITLTIEHGGTLNVFSDCPNQVYDKCGWHLEHSSSRTPKPATLCCVLPSSSEDCTVSQSVEYFISTLVTVLNCKSGRTLTDRIYLLTYCSRLVVLLHRRPNSGRLGFEPMIASPTITMERHQSRTFCQWYFTQTKNGSYKDWFTTTASARSCGFPEPGKSDVFLARSAGTSSTTSLSHFEQTGTSTSVSTTASSAARKIVTFSTSSAARKIVTFSLLSTLFCGFIMLTPSPL